MDNFWDHLNVSVKELAASWPSYTVLGSFALYLLGYLSLRFHLTALGVSTDLNVIDERYLFTGAKFVVFLVSTIPILLLLLGPLALIAYYVFRIARPRLDPDRTLLTRPIALCVLGIVFAVLIIQFIMRQCFFYSNLLLACRLPGPPWLRSMVLQEDDGLRSLYFSGLVAGCALTGALLFFASRSKTESAAAPFFKGLLALLLAIQFLFLPVNYGTLIMDKTLPKIASFDGQAQSADPQDAWLVWEGGEGVTYLVRKAGAENDQPKLITVPRKEVKRTEISGYDPILRVLFASGGNRTCNH